MMTSPRGLSFALMIRWARATASNDPITVMDPRPGFPAAVWILARLFTMFKVSFTSAFWR